jgi:hypothetical protein
MRLDLGTATLGMYFVVQFRHQLCDGTIPGILLDRFSNNMKQHVNYNMLFHVSVPMPRSDVGISHIKVTHVAAMLIYLERLKFF